MEPRTNLSLLVLFSSVCCCFFFASFCCAETNDDSLHIYVVHVAPPPSNHVGTHREWHDSFLRSENISDRLVYSYRHALSGFAARLTHEEVEALRKKDGFVHAWPNQVIPLATTYTPAFLGLHGTANGFWAGNVSYGKGVIIGVVDTGIFPTHPSFNDDGMPSPPCKWKGKCEFNASLCNNKIIGARTFNLTQRNDVPSAPFDSHGHGTHTAGTAAGRFVSNANVLGNARGTAAGMAPDAHLAIYKVCGNDGCFEADIVAGIDSALEDGVDVLSMSLGRLSIVPLYNDTLAIATFGAMKKGVFVSASAGNLGPYSKSLGNDSPWILTVGASTTDRRIRAVVKLGNGTDMEGESLYLPSNLTSTSLPLVYPQLGDDYNASWCSNATTLKRIGVEGKVVLCEYYSISNEERGEIVKEAGGLAMIVMNPKYRGFDLYAKVNPFPTVNVNNFDGLLIQEYINSSTNPMATLAFMGTEIGGLAPAVAPAIATFSSRGPSRVIPGFVKPDIVGPGMNVLAAWPTSVGPFKVTPPFNMISGTSMSCPHLSGIAALLKSAHPSWSPAMIKSAIITTADTKNLKDEAILDLYNLAPADFYVMGAGHVNPIKANNPGLVYDTQVDDYTAYLCGLGYRNAQVSAIANTSINCLSLKKLESADLNYPSLVVPLDVSNNFSRKVVRTVTNVGEAESVYKLSIVPPPGISVAVTPESLNFSSQGEKQTFSISVSLDRTAVQQPHCTNLNGYFEWISSNGFVRVRSPMVVNVCK